MILKQDHRLSIFVFSHTLLTVKVIIILSLFSKTDIKSMVQLNNSQNTISRR